MADELNKKKPDLGAGVSSPAPSPAPKANPNPAPKVNAPKPAAAPKQNSGPAPAPKANNFSAPKQTAPEQSKADPVRQKIINQGFAPKDWKKSAIDDIDKLGSTNVGVGNGKAVDAYKYNNKFYARTYPDRENGAPSEDDMSDISFKGADGNDIDGFDTFEELMEALHKDGYPVDEQLRGQPQSEKIYTDSHGVEWKKNPDKGDGKNYGYSRVDDPNITSNIPADTGANPEEGWDAEPMNEENKRLLNEIPDVDEQQPAWNKENDPGSGVVTKELTDWVRNYLTEQVGEDYANTTAANLHKDHNQADFYKGKMKEAYEREQASQLYKTDLKKKYPWWPDENYQEPEGFRSEEWFDADLTQKSDEDLIKMHDNLSKKLYNLRYRSPEENALQSKIEKEYLKRHPDEE